MTGDPPTIEAGQVWFAEWPPSREILGLAWTVADARRLAEETRRLIRASRAAIEDGRNHIIKSEENMADAQRLLALAKVRAGSSQGAVRCQPDGRATHYPL